MYYTSAILVASKKNRIAFAVTPDCVSLLCNHFDAYRFFTPAARPLNTLRPGRDDRTAYEQPGCLHAGMDLYKHAFRLSPLVCSDLVADCFALAREIRELDMRTSPYDLSELGYPPCGSRLPRAGARTPTPSATSLSAAHRCACG